MQNVIPAHACMDDILLKKQLILGHWPEWGAAGSGACPQLWSPLFCQDPHAHFASNRSLTIQNFGPSTALVCPDLIGQKMASLVIPFLKNI